MRRKQHVLTAATLVLIGGAAVSCGGNSDSTSAADPSSSTSPSSSSSSSAPSAPSAGADASSEFCTGLTKTTQITNGKEVAAFVDTLTSLSLPDDAPAAATDGFDVYVKALGTVDKGATTAELKKMGDLGLSAGDKQKVQSFLAYAGQACAPAAPESPSASPSQ